MMATYEIINQSGDTLMIQSSEQNAVDAILSACGFTGNELLLDLCDWRGCEWFDGKNTRTARQRVIDDLESIGNEVHFESLSDITGLVNDGLWMVKDGRAYCVRSLPTGNARKNIKRRCDFSAVPKQHIWAQKLNQLKELGLRSRIDGVA